MFKTALSDKVFLHLTLSWWNTLLYVLHAHCPFAVSDWKENSGWRFSCLVCNTQYRLNPARVQASWSYKSHNRHCTDVCQKEYQPLLHSAEPLWALWKKPLLRNCTAQWSVKKGVKMRKPQYIFLYSNMVIHHLQRLEIKMTLLHLFHLGGPVPVAETSSWYTFRP